MGRVLLEWRQPPGEPRQRPAPPADRVVQRFRPAREIGLGKGGKIAAAMTGGPGSAVLGRWSARDVPAPGTPNLAALVHHSCKRQAGGCASQ